MHNINSIIWCMAKVMSLLFRWEASTLGESEVRASGTAASVFKSVTKWFLKTLFKKCLCEKVFIRKCLNAKIHFMVTIVLVLKSVIKNFENFV